MENNNEDRVERQEMTSDDVYNLTSGHIIANVQTITKPLVMFFGPREVGKTVVLIRLALYLQNKGVDIKSVQDFRSDSGYLEVLERYERAMRNNHLSPERTAVNECLLLDTFLDGEHICNFLEASGEDFFDHIEPTRPYPNYLNKIFTLNQKKVFVFIFSDGMFPRETNLGNAVKNYTQRINKLLNQGKVDPSRDALIVLYNKVDESSFVKEGKVNIDGLKEHFLNNHPILKNLFNDRKSAYNNIKFVPFSSGEFSKIKGIENYKEWAHSKDEYPEELWRVIWNAISQGASFPIINKTTHSHSTHSHSTHSHSGSYSKPYTPSPTGKIWVALSVIIFAIAILYYAFF